MNTTPLCIRRATIARNTTPEICDILVENGKISAIQTEIPVQENWRIVNADGLLLTYGLCDLHVHFREPGYEYKETIHSGSMAAAHGGYTTVCPMPNLNPAPDTPEHIALETDIIQRTAVVDVLPYATLTLGRKGLTPVDMAALKPYAIAFSDDGSGIQEDSVMQSLMQSAARENVIIAAHCEDNRYLNGGYIHDGAYAQAHHHRGISSESEWRQIERDLKIAEATGCRYHVCHISTRESVNLIREYKHRGVRVTCETGPHYLVLCEDDLQEDGRFKMNPPLRSASDQAALIEGLLDGTIDAIATDHAPHSQDEKNRGLEKSAMGIVGLETAFPVLFTHLVEKNILTLNQLIDLMSNNPRKIFRINGSLEVGQPADLALFNLQDEYTIHTEDFKSKGKATPFEGWQVKGRCVMTFKNGIQIQ
ncbi:MAG: dihydroorotase [Bacteroidales bacterium]|nr:dihydroorotase [Bacteroidales bacterium]